MAVTVYFIRHGQTYFNLFARLQGWSDTPLTQKGRADAAAAGRTLAPIKIDYLFSSDLKRAVDTARIMIANHPGSDIKEPKQSELFREVFYGSFEGHANEEGAIYASYMVHKRIRRVSMIIKEYGIQETQQMFHDADPSHLAESKEQLDHRCEKAISFLSQIPDRSTAVVASHGSIICYLANLYAEQGKQYSIPDNGAIMKMIVEKGQPHIEFYNRLELPKQ